jgi:hypothetical protein
MTRTSAALFVLMAVLLNGCGGVTTQRPADERPVLSEYKGWRIGVTPSLVQTNRWRARVRVWPPEVQPDTHPGVLIYFSDTAADRRAIEQAATAAARRYIDASQPLHQEQR